MTRAGVDLAPDVLAGRLAARLPVGSGLGHGGDVTVLEVRHDRDGNRVLVLVRWDGDHRTYGIPVGLGETGHDYYYRGLPVASPDHWTESVVAGIGIETAAGLRSWAGRRRGDDHIELRRDDRWPIDDRYACSEVLGRHEEIEEALDLDGIDPEPARTARIAGRLRGWVILTENQVGHARWLGQSVVADRGDGTGELTHWQVGAGVPTVVRIGLARSACLMAAATGVRRIVTIDSDPDLALMGFRERDGQRVVDCDFLDADHRTARSRLTAERAVTALPLAGRVSVTRSSPAPFALARAPRWWQALRQLRPPRLSLVTPRSPG